MKAIHWRFIMPSHGGGISLENTDGGFMDIITSRTKGRVALQREAARRLRLVADELEKAANGPGKQSK